MDDFLEEITDHVEQTVLDHLHKGQLIEPIYDDGDEVKYPALTDLGWVAFMLMWKMLAPEQIVDLLEDERDHPRVGFHLQFAVSKLNPN